MNVRRLAAITFVLAAGSDCHRSTMNLCRELNSTISIQYAAVLAVHRSDSGAKGLEGKATPEVRKAIDVALSSMAKLERDSATTDIGRALAEFRESILRDGGDQDNDIVFRFSEATARLLDKVNLQCAGER